MRCTSERSGVGCAAKVAVGNWADVAFGAGAGSEVEHAAIRTTATEAAPTMRRSGCSIITPPLYGSRPDGQRPSLQRIG